MNDKHFLSQETERSGIGPNMIQELSESAESKALSILS